jgi:hypothetical protein
LYTKLNEENNEKTEDAKRLAASNDIKQLLNQKFTEFEVKFNHLSTQKVFKLLTLVIHSVSHKKKRPIEISNLQNWLHKYSFNCLAIETVSI